MSELIPDGRNWDGLQSLDVSNLHLHDDAWILYRKQQLEAALKYLSNLMDRTPRWKKQEYSRMYMATRTHRVKLAKLNNELRERSVTVSLPLLPPSA